MSANQFRAYGLTTARVTVGASTVHGVSAGPGVLDMVICGVTGAAVYMAGASFAVSGNLIAAGAMIPTGTAPLNIGLGPAFFAGAPAEFSVIKYLSDPGTLGASVYQY